MAAIRISNLDIWRRLMVKFNYVIRMLFYFEFFFYIHGSVHRNSVLIRSNKMQQYAGVYLLQNYSTCFGCPSHPSSGVHQTVTAASGTGPVPEAAVTVLCTPDDGCDGHPKHVE